LRAFKELVEQRTAATFNSCLLNLYHDGSEGMAWHSDDEKSLNRHATIASLSFGAERKFCLKHKRQPVTVAVVLEHDSLLVMKDATQTNWLHSIPKSKRVLTPRINLTFRTMIET
jgi:alkylated DNA repair dioxygenase AlkB